MSAVCVSIIQGICWLWLSTNFISGWQLFGEELGYLAHSSLSITPQGLALPLALWFALDLSIIIWVLRDL